MTPPGGGGGAIGTPEVDAPTPGSNLLSLKPVLEVVALVTAPVSTAAALLVYFGWVRAKVEADFFGLDPASFGYSTQEHIVRSVGPMIGPLTLGAVLIVVGLSANGWIGHSWSRLRTQYPRIAGLRRFGVAGLVLMLAGGLWQWHLGPRHSYVAPLLLAGGAVLAAVGLALSAMPVAPDGEPHPTSSPAAALPAGVKLALALILVLAAFGFVARRAQAEGFSRSRDLVDDLGQLPAATLFTEQVLTISHRGVTCLPVSASRYTRRYDGLHLMAHRNDKYFLILRAYDTNNAVALVLDEAPGLRLEVDASPRMRAAAGLDALDTVRQAPDVIC